MIDPNLVYPGSDLTNVFPEEGSDIPAAARTGQEASDRATSALDEIMTINRLRTVPVVHEDGTPVHAGDLIKGKEYFVDLETGILRDKKRIRQMTAQEILEGITRHRANPVQHNVPSGDLIASDMTRKINEIEWALQALAELLRDKEDLGDD